MFDAISKLVESNGISAEDAEALNTEVDSKLKEFRDEAKDTRLKLEDMTKSFNGVNTTLGKLESEYSGMDQKILDAKEAGKADTVKILEQERTSAKGLIDELSVFRTENKKLKINSAVNDALNTYNIKSDVKNDVVGTLSGMIKIEDDKFTFGDDNQSVEDGIKAFFEVRGSYLEASGAGSGSGAGEGGNSGRSVTPKLNGTQEQKLAGVGAIIDSIKG
jgi:hypothetical protein